VTVGLEAGIILAIVLYSELGVVGERPLRSVETHDHSGLRHLRYLAVVGGVGLTGDDEDLSYAYVRNGEKHGLAGGIGGFNLDGMEATSDNGELTTELLFVSIKCKALPSPRKKPFDGSSLDSCLDALGFRGAATEKCGSVQPGAALKDLVFESRGNGKRWGVLS